MQAGVPLESPPHGMTVGGLFAGIGGLELGFQSAGFTTTFMCEIDSDARTVLMQRFSGVDLLGDIADIRKLTPVSVLAAGFPCQDLSAVGPRNGLDGAKSALVHRLLDLVEAAHERPEWIALENVPFMLQLKRGAAIGIIVKRLEDLGYDWAYRVVDSRAFGLPQRRRRVFLVATNGETDPSRVLFADNAEPPPDPTDPQLACGFYWTEGNTGVGWAIDAIPTLKGGSSLSIPSPPAIWLRDRSKIILPDIRDAERLQGFEADWTMAVEERDPYHRRRRWRLVGNAVSVTVARWLAGRIASPGEFDDSRAASTAKDWPKACRGGKGWRQAVDVTEWPVHVPRPHLAEFLDHEGTPISQKAASGFLFRARKSTLRLAPGFLEAVAEAAGLDRSEATRETYTFPSMVAAG